ncbi:MAG: dienelactone hydrolase family protein, partial [Acidobacteriales bacterium]|nr:dienelactone hydrolase family protein [Terriglobales bacterium]
KSGSETVKGYVFTPHSQPVKGKLPAIIVVHEWWGLVPWVSEQAQKFADQGYLTLAIDLYRGQSATTPDRAHELMRAVPEDRSARDLKAAFDYLKTRDDVDTSRIGTIGWCMGGGYALKLAELEPTLRAAVINYGAITSDADTLKPIGASVLGIFGGKDEGIRPDDVRAFEKAMKAQGTNVEIFIYDDAGHGFENPNNKRGYNQKDAEEAYRHQTEFFARTLKP